MGVTPETYAWFRDEKNALDRLLEMKQEYDQLQVENAKLREMLADDNEELAKMRRVIDHLYSFAKTCGVDVEDMRELGVEV